MRRGWLPRSSVVSDNAHEAVEGDPDDEPDDDLEGEGHGWASGPRVMTAPGPSSTVGADKEPTGEVK